jgi:hypothetical protein
MRVIRRALGLASLACAAAMAQAQPTENIGRRINSTTEGTVRFSFAAREGVCGNGNGWTNWTGAYTGTYAGLNGRKVREVEPQCDRGPVRISLDRVGGRTVAVRTYVGGTWARTAEGTDVGQVPAAEGAAALLEIAERAEAKPAEQAMQGITLADSVTTWPRLAALARNAERPLAVRKSATFWLAQAAGDRITATLMDIAQDDEHDDIRKQAVFALSQRPKDEGVPALLGVARNAKASAAVRKSAFFWLGQSNDPRAVAFLEETLTKP